MITSTPGWFEIRGRSLLVWEGVCALRSSDSFRFFKSTQDGQILSISLSRICSSFEVTSEGYWQCVEVKGFFNDGSTLYYHADCPKRASRLLKISVVGVLISSSCPLTNCSDWHTQSILQARIIESAICRPIFLAQKKGRCISARRRKRDFFVLLAVVSMTTFQVVEYSFYDHNMASHYSLILTLQLVILLVDLVFNAVATLIGNNNTTLLMVYMLQDTLIVIAIIVLAITFSSTFVFQAGLIAILLEKFSGSIVFSILYLLTSILFHYNSKWDSKGFDTWTPWLHGLYLFHRIIAILYYTSYKRAALLLSDPKYHGITEWLKMKLSQIGH